jgi:peptidyl-tRNA hydrolase, PTH1 family
VKVIVGLGNPGLSYEETRHNIGFKVIEMLRTKYSAHYKQDKQLSSQTAKCKHGSQDILLVRPLTYMNLSGQAVLAVKNWFKVDLSHFLIIHDDVSLPLGKLRLQKSGGAGGQHGVESIIEHLGGSKDFNRLKIGVGPDPGGERRADFVLSAFPVTEQDLLKTALLLAEEATLTWLDNGIDFAMNKCNGKESKKEIL